MAIADTRFPSPRLAVEALVTLSGVLLLAWAWRATPSWYEHHMLWRFCAVEPKELLHGKVWRWAGAVAGIVTLVGVRLLMGRWAERQAWPELLGLLARIAAAVALALLACELILRVVGVKERPRFKVPFVADDGALGWRNQPASRVTEKYGGTEVTYVIDPGGNRVGSIEGAPDPTAPTIIFNGESMTFGFGMNYQDTYPALVSDTLHTQVANIAVSAYAVDQEYMRLREELPRFAHPLAVVTLVVPAQLIRVLYDRPTHFIPKLDGTIEERPSYVGWWRWSSLSYVFRSTIDYHSDSPIAVARDTFTATARDARARGAYPLFVLTNWGPQCLPDGSGKPSIESALFAGLDVPHIRVDLELSWWNPAIDHPDGVAHRHIADAIAQALRETPLAAR